jgi:ketosteroid isomerase-like protein
MKSFITLCCLAFASILAAQSADEAAIKELVQTDVEAYIQRDFTTWQNLWHHSELATMLGTSGTYVQGWDSIRSGMKETFEAATEPRPFTPSLSNFFFNIRGDQAYVSFVQTMTSDITVGGEPRMNKTLEVRNLVKIDGEWKICNQMTAPLRYERRTQDAVDRLNMVANMLMGAERVEDTGKVFALMADLYPEYPLGYWGMGYLAFAQQDKAGALKHLEKAMSLFDDTIPPGLQSLYEQAQALE